MSKKQVLALELVRKGKSIAEIARELKTTQEKVRYFFEKQNRLNK